MIRNLHRTIDRENAPIGVFLTMTDPTAEMRREARCADTWTSQTRGREYPRIQIITVAEAFAGKRVEYFGQDMTLQAAPTAKAKTVQLTMPGAAPSATKKPKKRCAARCRESLASGSMQPPTKGKATSQR